MAAPGMMRFYYQGQEFETTQASWDAAIACARGDGQRSMKRWSRPADCTSLARSGMSRGASTTSFADARTSGRSGSSRFFLSLEDDLMRIFAREWVSHAAAAAGHGRGRADREQHDLEAHRGAQKAVESQNFEARKHVLEYDDVMNKQREAVYGLRRQLMEGVDQKQLIIEDYVSTILEHSAR